MHQGNILLSICLSFLFGVFLASFFSFKIALLVSISSIFSALLFSFLKKNFVLAGYFIFGATFLFLGIFYFGNIQAKFNQSKYLGELRFEGEVIEEPDVRQYQTILILKSNALDANVRVSADNFVEYYYGDIVLVDGILERPENFGDFDWRGYLSKENIGYVMYRSDIIKTGTYKHGVAYFLNSTKLKLEGGLDKSLLPPHSSLYSTMLFADKFSLSKEGKATLTNAGLSHIVAVSGMNVVAIAIVILYASLGIGLWRKHAAIFTLLFLVVYVAMIGYPASAVRAVIMASVLIVSELLGRPNFALRALIVTAAIMVLINPLALKYDVGFQLSLLAVLGIILFYEKLLNLSRRIPDIFHLRQVIAMTFSAQVFTFPVILYNFHKFPWVSLFSNILVVPTLPFAMSAGFIASVGGLISEDAGFIFAMPAWLFSNYIWGVVGLFS